MYLQSSSSQNVVCEVLRGSSNVSNYLLVWNYFIIILNYLLLYSVDIWISGTNRVMHKSPGPAVHIKTVADVFQNSNFCLKALILYGIKFCCSKWQAHFICFWENRYKYPCLNNYSLLLFQVKIVFHEKNNQLASSAHTSITQIFFFKTNIIVWYAAVVS